MISDPEVSRASSPLIGPPTSALRARIGLSRVDITPPVGIYARNWGAAETDVSDANHRALTLNAMTLESAAGGPPLVLIDGDLGYWTTLETFHALQKSVLTALKLPSSHFLFAMTHTHASPHLSDPMPEWPGRELLDKWLRDLSSAVIDVTRRALKDAASSLLEWHTGRCALAADRDLPDPAAPSARIVCGYNPAATADDTLLVGRITDESGKIRATIVNYACHPTTLAWQNHAVSPDFIGAMRETIQNATGGAQSFFLQGASGQLAPKYQYVGDVSIADRHGRQLAYAALATLEDMEAPGTRLRFDRVVESGAPLAVWLPQQFSAATTLNAVESTCELPIRDWPSADELDQQYRECPDRALAERLRRKRNIRRTLGDQSSWALPVYCWRLGNAIVIGSMVEAYSQFQQQLRSSFPDHHIICLNVVNGSVGYLTPSERYDQNIYQVWQSPFDRGCLETYIQSARQLIEQMFHPILPEPAQ